MISAIIQARMLSTRLPGKVMADIEGKSLLLHVIERVRKAKKIDTIIVATTNKKDDQKIIAICKKAGVKTFIGSEDDVLDRYYQAAKKNNSDIVVRVTPDDPFKDPEIIDGFLDVFLKNDFDYVSNTIHPTYPEGLDIEIFSFNALQKAWQEAKKPFEREHVTPYIWQNSKKFKIKNISHKKDLSHLRWTIDYLKDLQFAREIYKRLYEKKPIFLMQDILEVLEREPELIKINKGVIRNEGLAKSLKKEKLLKK